MAFTRKHIISLVLLLLFFSPAILFTKLITPAQADQSLITEQEGLSEVGMIFGGSRAEQDIRYMAARIISIVLGFLTVIFLGLTVFAGFKYMTAGGNQDKASDALKLIRNAIIGLVIVLSAWMVTRFVIIMLNRAARNAELFLPSVGM